MAACTRASGTGHHLLRVVAEVAEHHDRGVAAGDPGDRAAHTRRSAGLVEPGDRHPVGCPPRDGSLTAAEGVAPIAAVEGAADHVRVPAFDVLRALDVG